jgi:hypothetical protein
MFTDKFYSKVYFSTIEKAKQRGWKKARGRERHHIIPQSLGGSNDKNNLVYLSCREHFLCHWLLVKMTEGESYHKMVYALMGMRAENEHQERYQTIFTARVYEKYRIKQSEYHSQLMKSKNLIPWNKGGVEITEKHRENIRKAARTRNIDPIKQAEGQRKRVAKMIGRKQSEETCHNKSLALKGKLKGPMSEEQKQIRSDKQKGIPKPKGFGDKVAERMKKTFSENNPNRRPDLQKTCEHCGKIVGPSNYTRWHGDNCKSKETK